MAIQSSGHASVEIKRLADLIDWRYARSGGVDLFTAGGREAFCDIGLEWTWSAYESRGSLRDALAGGRAASEAVTYMVRATSDRVYARNQFVSISGRERARMRERYARLLASAFDLVGSHCAFGEFARRAEMLVADHCESLRSFFQSIEDAPLLSSGRHVACGEYSPELQLTVLGLGGEIPAGPVLDIGCGAGGDLVRYLRLKGVEAYGFDRSVGSSDCLLEADWMETDFGRERWGTVIAHMSFSNHFAHHHLRRGGRYADYARKYMEILGALAPGGRFAYAPRLPFIERLLPDDRYAVEHPTGRCSHVTRPD